MPRATRSHTRLLNPARAEDGLIQTVVVMDTFVTIQIARPAASAAETNDQQQSVARAFEWFERVESCCSRFDERSELRQLTAAVGVPVPASTMLFEAVQFALAVADDTGGAFDPTVGRAMEARGFNREYRTGRIVDSAPGGADQVSYRDVHLDPIERTITLGCPLTIDLGAVAKGLAIDMAARELARFEHYAIDAGGDLYLAGCNQDGAPWTVGIRDPREDVGLIDVLAASDRAVCTSGGYERQSTTGAHHILDPREMTAAVAAVSATVVASTAMLADALATAAFVLGPVAGIQLLERHGVEGAILSPAFVRHATRGYAQ